MRLDTLEKVELVVHLEHRQLVGADLAKHREHLLDLLITFGLVSIDHVQQEVGVAGLFQRRPERFHQLVRQMTDEAHRVGQDHRPDILELEAAQRGIERGEQLIGCVDLGFGQGIE